MSLEEKKHPVLVVDDVEVNVMILEEILQDSYEVITASNGQEALEKLRSMPILPKLILLDVFMPIMNGYQMFDIMKADEALRRIPVIFITTADSEGAVLAAGAVDFISKPFLPEIVKLRVKNQAALKEYSDNLEVMVADKTAEATKILNRALQGLANAIEHRDLESGEHVKRTQLYLRALITHLLARGSVYKEELLRLDPEIIVDAMALHDVGKIAIPDRILLKPGRLDEEEMRIMRTHTQRGAEIISELGDPDASLYLRHCADICSAHHERFDGRGYHRGLAGQEIPLTARLASLADVYDALVCTRVYKAPLPFPEAVRIIREGRGTQFDPLVVDAFLEIQVEFQDIARRHPH
jgi:putative two-component system response regulator